MVPTETIKLRDAIASMRALTRVNATFSFSFISYSEDLKKSDGLKVVERGLLRTGYRDNQSSKSRLLIAYIEYGVEEKNRQFYLPLLMTFNNKRIIP